MNKSELVKAVAEDAEISMASAGRVVDSLIQQISTSLAAGGQVTLPGFGIFCVKGRAARTCRHPHTGETMQVAATVNPSFKPGKALKDQVRAAHKETA